MYLVNTRISLGISQLYAWPWAMWYEVVIMMMIILQSETVSNSCVQQELALTFLFSAAE